jgi:hypothetical protein
MLVFKHLFTFFKVWCSFGNGKDFRLASRFILAMYTTNKSIVNQGPHWRHDIQHNDTQHNDIQHNDTQHKGLICDTQYK